jgi:hypothetical protein
VATADIARVYPTHTPGATSTLRTGPLAGLTLRTAGGRVHLSAQGGLLHTATRIQYTDPTRTFAPAGQYIVADATTWTPHGMGLVSLQLGRVTLSGGAILPTTTPIVGLGVQW